jgi:hypothetical protein
LPAHLIPEAASLDVAAASGPCAIAGFRASSKPISSDHFPTAMAGVLLLGLNALLAGGAILSTIELAFLLCD